MYQNVIFKRKSKKRNNLNKGVTIMKIKVNGINTSRVMDALAEAIDCSYERYADIPTKEKNARGYIVHGYRIGNMWHRTSGKLVNEVISLIELGVFDITDKQLVDLKNAKYSDGFRCFTITED